jgi:AcrR family transcriptional regulator
MVRRIERNERITKARKEQILNAAMSVFSSKGYGEATVADIAKIAGIGVGTIYHYYKDKRELLLLLIGQILISENLLNIMKSMSRQTTDDFVQSLFADRLKLALSAAQVLPFIFFEIQRQPRLRKQFMSQVALPQIEKMEHYIRQQKQEGNFRDVNERIVVRTMIGALIGTVMFSRLEMRDSPYRKSNVDAISKELSALFLYGLKKR